MSMVAGIMKKKNSENRIWRIKLIWYSYKTCPQVFRTHNPIFCPNSHFEASKPDVEGLKLLFKTHDLFFFRGQIHSKMYVFIPKHTFWGCNPTFRVSRASFLSPHPHFIIQNVILGWCKTFFFSVQTSILETKNVSYIFLRRGAEG